jgi:hypothetical protein
LGLSNDFGSPGAPQPIVYCPGANLQETVAQQPTYYPCPSGASLDYFVAGTSNPYNPYGSAPYGTQNGSHPVENNLWSYFIKVGLLKETTGSGPNATGYMRFGIPWDAIATYDPSTGQCVQSPFFAASETAAGTTYPNYNGGQLFGWLVWDIQYAEDNSLQPEIVILPGSGLSGTDPNNHPISDPEYPEPGSGSSSEPFVGWSTQGSDYSCGVVTLIDDLKAELHGQSDGLTDLYAPQEYEAWNEPDQDHSYYTGSYFSGTQSACTEVYADCGQLEAAELWEIFQIDNQKLGWGYKIAAMTLSAAENSNWENAYLSQMSAIYQCDVGFTNNGTTAPCTTGSSDPFYLPQYWAVHDYDDLDADGDNDLLWFQAYLGYYQQDYGFPNASIWVTETGNWLGSDAVTGPVSDDNDNATNCQVQAGEPTGDDTEPIAGHLWCLVDGNAANQEAGANLFESGFPGDDSADINVTEEFWFELQGTDQWDSALLDWSSPALPRPSYCVLTGFPVADCTGSLWTTPPPSGSDNSTLQAATSGTASASNPLFAAASSPSVQIAIRQAASTATPPSTAATPAAPTAASQALPAVSPALIQQTVG